jgi:hypothetical protein
LRTGKAVGRPGSIKPMTSVGVSPVNLLVSVMQDRLDAGIEIFTIYVTYVMKVLSLLFIFSKQRRRFTD